MSDFEDIILQGLEDYGENIIRILTEELVRADKVASGRLINSLNYEVRPVGEALYQLILTSEDYLKYVDKGRRPGSYVPIRALREWVRFRGIPETAVYAINQNIFRFGIRPTNVISATIDRLDNELDGVEKAYEEYISSIIIARIKNIG